MKALFIAPLTVAEIRRGTLEKSRAVAGVISGYRARTMRSAAAGQADPQLVEAGEQITRGERRMALLVPFTRRRRLMTAAAVPLAAPMIWPRRAGAAQQLMVRPPDPFGIRSPASWRHGPAAFAPKVVPPELPVSAHSVVGGCASGSRLAVSNRMIVLSAVAFWPLFALRLPRPYSTYTGVRFWNQLCAST